MTQGPHAIFRPRPGPRPRRSLLALALALSAGAHVGFAAMLWVGQPARPDAGAVVEIEIVADAGEAAPGSASASPAGTSASRVPAATSRPARASAPPAAPPPQAPRAAGEPPALAPTPARPAPAMTAPNLAEAAPTAKPLRRPARVPPSPASVPRAADSSPPPPAARPTRPQSAAIPLVAADAAPGVAAPGAAAPSAGPEPGSSPPRYGFGSAANPIPRYPEAARARGWEGLVLLAVGVAADGRADSVAVARSSGHTVLDEAALDAVRRWRFAPARRAGIPVPGTAAVPIRFRLED